MAATSAELSYIKGMMQRWALPTHCALRSEIFSYLLGDTCHSFSLTRRYLEEVKTKVPWLLEDPELLSNGLLYAGLGGLIVLCNYDYLEKLHGEQLFTIVTRRLITWGIFSAGADFLLDDDTFAATALTQMKVLIGSIVKKEKLPQEDLHPRILSLFALLQSLIEEIPALIPCVVRVFQAEVDSMAQKKKDLSVEELYRIESQKGALSGEMAGVLLAGSDQFVVPPGIGILAQYIDDFCDFQIDQKAGIETMALQAVRKKGVVDRIVFQALQASDLLPANYWPFKVLLGIVVANFTCQTLYVSKELNAIMFPYRITFHRGKEKEGLPIWRNALYRHFRFHL